ncbi:MAG: activator of (R)-2-hydroxyglutaryl-CoA dehydratase, partial [Acidobacteria bacterium]|nr:activator of (R)-2-hydroxyglutaryl-CoA dehydratase [Acidobacteriota bacterium]
VILGEEIESRIAEERARLRRNAGLEAREHFRRPRERAFTAAERDKVTLLFGGLTWKHEAFIRAVFEGSGYKCENIPTADVSAFQIGKEYGNNGQCNPTYFTVGNLVKYLQQLEAQGLSRQEIMDNYVFFTAGSCGPCRFGMYEAEYRFALQNAGFDGFRVLLFQQNDGIKAASGEPGLKFTCDFGVGMLNALNLGDTINDLIHQIRPFEVNRGETDRVFAEAVDDLCRMLRERPPFEIMEAAPAWAKDYLLARRKLRNTLNSLGKVREHLYGKPFYEALEQCRERLDSIEVDRTRIKPVVKITGEFWAHITEGDGNFHMFRFLEREGAQVLVEPIATFVTYLTSQGRLKTLHQKEVEAHHLQLRGRDLKRQLALDMKYRKKRALLWVGESLWTHFYHRVGRLMGGLAHELVPQDELAKLAHPFFHKMTRGGEGHMEIGKNIYYTTHHLCHMVLALKPFGCMPSSQSDGVQSAVMNKFKDMIFLPIETSGEGEVNAHSRVQMALGEARAKARNEFETALKRTGKSLEDIKDYVAGHPELRRPFYHVPHRRGYAGMASHFILHVSDRMDRDAGLLRRARGFLSLRTA